MTMTVESPPGCVIGKVRQALSCLPPKFDILDSSDNIVLQVEGPACMLWPQFCEQKFEVGTKYGAGA